MSVECVSELVHGMCGIVDSVLGMCAVCVEVRVYGIPIFDCPIFGCANIVSESSEHCPLDQYDLCS